MKHWHVMGLAAIIVVALLLMAPDVVLALDLGDAADQLKTDTNSFGKLAIMTFGVVGVVVVGVGIVKAVNSHKNHEPIGGSVSMILGGAMLTALIAFVGLATQSTVQKDPSAQVQGFGN